MTYNFFTNKQTQTPQTQPIPGREAEMMQARSGAYTFDAGIWKMLRRCLLIGSSQNAYYADKHELTDDFVNTVKQAVAEDPARTAQEIVYASDGKAINNSAPILALVLLSMGETPAAKTAFMEIFLQVVRTGSHFYEWLNYTKSLRGMGKIVRAAGRSWLAKADAKAVAYQILKYQQRNGFTHRDALRLFHVQPPTPDHELLYHWAVKGWDELPTEIPSLPLAQIWWYEWLKRNPDRTHEAIVQGRLTHEMAAPVGKMDIQAWQLLFEEMPIGAMLRNLGSLTELGVLRADKTENLDRVESVLNNRDRVRAGRIHPIDVLKALKTYQSGGKIGKSEKTWTPVPWIIDVLKALKTYQSGGKIGKSKKTWTAVPRIIDILEKTVELAFDSIEPTGKVFMHAVDISGSMSWNALPSVGLTCCEIATAMALASAKAETNYMIRGFSTKFRDLGITKKDTFTSALAKAKNQNFGGTDASVAYKWMLKNDFKADVICFWTDSESWAGSRHPSQALAEYRRKLNPHAQAIYITLQSAQITLVDPQDPLSWDLGGFDPTMPRVIQTIASGNV